MPYSDVPVAIAPAIGEVLSRSAMQSRDERRRHENFGGERASRAIGTRQQPLRNGSAEHAGELMADLPLMMRRKHRDDPVDRLGRVERVKRREHQVARFGGDERGLNRLEITQFAKQDDVGILRSALFRPDAYDAVSKPTSR